MQAGLSVTLRFSQETAVPFSILKPSIEINLPPINLPFPCYSITTVKDLPNNI